MFSNPKTQAVALFVPTGFFVSLPKGGMSKAVSVSKVTDSMVGHASK